MNKAGVLLLSARPQQGLREGNQEAGYRDSNGKFVSVEQTKELEMVSKVLSTTATVIKASKGVPAENLAIVFLGVVCVILAVAVAVR
ncbi:hypothetical protein GCM10027046_31020 [Uliginosibacterium flavum]